ncbi:MAG: ATP phosphoribosyltransferase regulatory subunit [Gammaproteobacteria bacterium]
MKTKQKNNLWLLPDGVEELLPDQARQLEQLRREVLDSYQSWGYELIQPPFIEYLDSLLTGSGHELDLKTFKLVDQISGRLLGLRADMTPQAARIDAHSLCSDEPTRLCYLGTVLHTGAVRATASRCPVQSGAELYGHAGPESDVEILQLMLNTLELTGLGDVHIDLGHVGIFRSLAKEAGLDGKQENLLFDALQRKAIPEIDAFLAGIDATLEQKTRLACLADLNGGIDILQEAKVQLDGCGQETQQALSNLIDIAERVQQALPEQLIYYDLAELRGYQYHTGLVFAAYIKGHGQEVARGGRYDDIGQHFGRARPAIGFSTDLAVLMKLGSRTYKQQQPGILAPSEADSQLQKKIRELRQSGERVVFSLPGQSKTTACDRVLNLHEGHWVVDPLS